MDRVTANPLCWPQGKPRTHSTKIRHGKFHTRQSSGYGSSGLTIRQATRRVFDQLDKFTKIGKPFRVESVVISSNLRVKADGTPYSSQKKPNDRGVAVYFKLDGRNRCIPCDSYFEIEDNLAAIAATIEALRTIERHGSEMFESAFSGFTALPSSQSKKTWREVLGYFGNDYNEAKKAYMKKRSAAHTDKGGCSDIFVEVTEAWDLAKQELRKI